MHRQHRLGSPDELVKQVIKADDYSSYIGSIFNSLSALDANTEESTSVLVKHYNDQIDREGLNNELEMTLPLATTFKRKSLPLFSQAPLTPTSPSIFRESPLS